MKRANILTHEQVLEIVELYANTPAKEIALLYNKPLSTIYKTAQRYGVKKSEEFRNSSLSGRIQKGQRLSEATEFKKGMIPATKGKKLSEICKSKEALQRSAANRWQKGNKPHTTKYDGAITLRRMQQKGIGECQPYYFIRIVENKWEFLHRYLWKESFGDIPKGFNIVFKDGNTLNCVIENLECISSAELAERNRITRYPKELQIAIKTKNKLIKKIKDHGTKSN